MGPGSEAMSKRNLNRLSARGLERALAPGRYADGGGLYLMVTHGGTRKWVFRFTQAGRQRDMGLGSAREVSLAAARDQATRARAHIRAGLDPIAQRAKERNAAIAAPTFGQMADDLIDSIESGFRNEKHRTQWRRTLEMHAGSLRRKPVNEVGTGDVLAVLTPIWQSIPETASDSAGG